MKKSLVVGFALFTAVIVLFTSASAQAQSVDDDPEQLAAGEAVFVTNCSQCHGSDGMGSFLGLSLIHI